MINCSVWVNLSFDTILSRMADLIEKLNVVSVVLITFIFANINRRHVTGNQKIIYNVVHQNNFVFL